MAYTRLVPIRYINDVKAVFRTTLKNAFFILFKTVVLLNGWSYVHTCPEKFRSGGGRIVTFPLRHRGCVHTYPERTWADLPFLGTRGFEAGAEILGVGPICCGADFAPAPPPLCDRVCLNACNDLCWSQFSAASAPSAPGMCECTLNHILTQMLVIIKK